MKQAELDAIKARWWELENAPVLMLDGEFGMVIRVPTENHPMVGIQVDGEMNIRWREPSMIVGEPLMETRRTKCHK